MIISCIKHIYLYSDICILLRNALTMSFLQFSKKVYKKPKLKLKLNLNFL